jgi:hypothetical protein
MQQLLTITGAIATRAARMEQIDVRQAELGASMGLLQGEATALSDERTTLVSEWSNLRVELFDGFAAALQVALAANGPATTYEDVGRVMDELAAATPPEEPPPEEPPPEEPPPGE